MIHLTQKDTLIFAIEIVIIKNLSKKRKMKLKN